MHDGGDEDQVRKDFVVHDLPTAFGVVEKPLLLRDRLLDLGWLRKGVILLALAALWEGYARWLDNPLLFPTFLQTAAAFFTSIRSGELIEATVHSVATLLQGYALGLVLAALATAFASSTRIGADLLDTLTAMFNPLPSNRTVAAGHDLVRPRQWQHHLRAGARGPVVGGTEYPRGFRSVSPTWRMVGQNYGLSRAAYVTKILIPGALPSILTGLKIGWAFAWRTLIAAELVFRGQLQRRRPRLVHLPEQESAGDSERLRRPADGDSLRPRGRESGLPHAGAQDRSALGHAVVKNE